MKRITFTIEEMSRVLSIINQHWEDEIACRYLELESISKIPKNVLRKIAKELRDSGLIRVATMFSENGPGPYGKGFVITHEGRLALRNQMKSIVEWAKEIGYEILDPDGYDRRDPECMTRLRTKEEFDKGFAYCTVIKIHNPK